MGERVEDMGERKGGGDDGEGWAVAEMRKVERKGESGDFAWDEREKKGKSENLQKSAPQNPTGELPLKRKRGRVTGRSSKLGEGGKWRLTNTKIQGQEKLLSCSPHFQQ